MKHLKANWRDAAAVFVAAACLMSFFSISAHCKSAIEYANARTAGLMNYPFRTSADMSKVYADAADLQSLTRNAANAADIRRTLQIIREFCETDDPSQKFWIEDFATSKNVSIVKLRDELRVPVPKGGAIVRIYYGAVNMPPAIRKLFKDNPGGITFWNRFIAINSYQKSPEQIDDILAHELVHAYVLSNTGLAGDAIPMWFHEGLAQYLAESRESYTVAVSPNFSIISNPPANYIEYHLIFKYLGETLSAGEFAQFVRQVVAQKSVDAPLERILGVRSYSELHLAALHHKNRRQLIIATSVLRSLLVIGIAVRIRLERWLQEHKDEIRLTPLERRPYEWEYNDPAVEADIEEIFEDFEGAENEALEILEDAQSLAQLGKRRTAREKVKQAVNLAAWSPRVNRAADSVRRLAGKLSRRGSRE